ncbi:MAG: hypothetical protein ABSE89_01765 [Sedimentisphaerales bacterium]
MGWKCKLIFLLIIYFSGFATAVYYLAPNGRMDCQAAGYFNSGNSSNSGANGSQNMASAGGALKQMCEKAYNKAAASFNNMDTAEFKAAFNRGVEKLKEMAKSNQSTKIEGVEDK